MPPYGKGLGPGNEIFFRPEYSLADRLLEKHLYHHAMPARASDIATLLAAPSLLVAPQLLGMTIRRTVESTGEVLEGTIVEVEAYLGAIDRAAHSYKGHRSARNEAMYARAGLAYVYFTYGMHHCMNIVCAHEGDPQAVLIRALEPTRGVQTMLASRRNGTKRELRDHDLCSGPGKLCQAMGIDRAHNGLDLLSRRSSVRLIAPAAAGNPGGLGKPGRLAPRIMVGPRIGIDSAGPPWRDRPLRFWLADSHSVSKSRAAGRPHRPRTTIPAWAKQKHVAVVSAD